MKKLLMVLPVVLGLSGCLLTQGGASTAPAAGGATSTNPATIGTFLNQLEAKRGTALSVVEKAGVAAAMTQTRGMIDGAQNAFLGKISQVSGLDTATLGVLFPQATQSVSQNQVLTAVENKLGKKLAEPQAKLAQTATALRNNSLDSLKNGLANKVGKAVGMDGEVIKALLPLAGF